MSRASPAYIVLSVCVIMVTQIPALFAEVCLPPLAIEIADLNADIPHVSLPNDDAILQLSRRVRLDNSIQNDSIASESVQQSTSELSGFIMGIPAQLQRQMEEHLRELTMSYQSYFDNHISQISTDQTVDIAASATEEEVASSLSQPAVDDLSAQIETTSSTNEHPTVQSTSNRVIVVQPHITRLLISFSSTEQNSVVSIDISTLLIYTDSYSNQHQQNVLRIAGRGQQRTVLDYDSTEQQLIEQINSTMNMVLINSVQAAIEKARKSILREYSRHLATDNAFVFISVGSSDTITVGTKLQIVSTDNYATPVCNSNTFFGMLQVLERYDDYLVAHTRGEFSVPPNALLITKPETVAIQPIVYVLIPVIEFAGYASIQQIAIGSGVRLYPRIGINRLQPFFALTVDTVIENEGVLLPLHGLFGLAMNWYSGRVTISPRLGGGIGVGSYIDNTETITSLFLSGLATVQGSLLLSPSLELGIELGYQFGIPLGDAITVSSQSLRTGYGGVFVGGTITFFD